MPDFRWSPIAEYSQTFWEWETRARASLDDFAVCTVNGEPAWTDGHILCLGQPPGPIRDTPIAMAHIERLLKETEREVYELQPVAVAELENPTVIFASGHTIQAKFFNLVREQWPGVRFFGDDSGKRIGPDTNTKPIIARIRVSVDPSELNASGPFVEQRPQKLVALIMPLRTDRWWERIDEVLALVKAK
jgi:hypothetical protein